MSVRQSLYGQSLVRNANALNFSHDSSQEKHWKRDWYSPSKSIPQSTSITPSATPTPFGDERDTPSLENQTYNFKVKAWVLDNDYKPVIDGDEEDLLDLEEFSIEKKKDANGLTDDAIRGAVGSGESIPGISDNQKPSESDNASKSELPDVESKPETPVGENQQETPTTTERLNESKPDDTEELETEKSEKEESSLPEDNGGESSKAGETSTAAEESKDSPESKKDSEGDIIVE